MPPEHARLFAFEQDFVDSLRCVPMAVRLKLDRVEIKLTLRQWSRLTLEDRSALLHTPCAAPAEVEAWRTCLIELVRRRTGDTPRPLPPEPPPAWSRGRRTPPAVLAYARSLGLAGPSDRQWAGLSELQRFALVKLSRDNHDNVNFQPALREFGLKAEVVVS